MIIVDKIKTPAPKWKGDRRVPSVFKRDVDRIAYWEKEKQYWREGYGEGHGWINGFHYFILTQGAYKDGSDGDLIRPKYRDCDEWITQEIYDAFWKLTNHVFITKRREIGLTSIAGGGLPAYTMRMFPSSTFGMTSCDKDRLYKAYNDKTDVFLRNMHKDIGPVYDRTVGFRENAAKQNLYARLPFLSKDMNGETAYLYADIFAKETTKDDKAANGFSGTRMRAAFIDELALHNRKKVMLNSMQSCFMKGPNQAGLLVAGGTVEDSISPEQIAELQGLIENADFFNFKAIFAPAWWGLVMDENGVSDEKKGVEWVMRERERLDKIDDKSYLKAFIKNYPLTIEEIFALGGGKGWDEYTVEKLNYQKDVLAKATDNLPVPHKIYVGKEDIICTPARESALEILEHPRPDVKYIVCVDGVATSDLTATGKANELSDFAAMVIKGVEPNEAFQFAPVALYCERPKTIEDANMRTVDLLKYYNMYGNAKIIGELNAAGEHLLKMVINEGLRNCLIYRKDINKTGFVDVKKPWFSRADTIKEWQFEAANVYFKKYHDQVRFKRLIIEALKGADKNTDVLDAFMAGLYGFGTGDLLNDRSVKKEKKKTKIWELRVDEKTGIGVWEETEY